MEQIYNDKMNSLGYSHLIVDIFKDWERVKDQLLIPQRKKGDGNGPVHIFLGVAKDALRKEFPTYDTSVKNKDKKALELAKVKHFFSKSNILSMIGHTCEYDFLHDHFSQEHIQNLLIDLKKEVSNDDLLETNSSLTLSIGRPYFKNFDHDGVFHKIVRPLLFPQSSYKISLYKNEQGEYAAFWLLGLEGGNNFEINPVITKDETKRVSSLQTIFYGTPGSGKSHRVKELTNGKKIHRTTFHPDSDYASFVGCYKPTIPSSSIQDILSFEELVQRIPEIKNEDNAIGKFAIKYYRSIQKLQETPERKELRRKIQEVKGMDSDGESQYAYMNQALALGPYLEREKLWRDDSISYAFVPQVFTEAYIDAWQNPEEEVYLVIEEINRGNCAQIFGDLFQLLDRNAEGKSDYQIKADNDLRDYLYGQLGENHDGIKNGELCLPPNLCIFATMNTSDQSLFPMDSAFKRRWDWEYVPIDYSEDIPSSKFIITLGDKKYRWVDFLKKVNKRILEVTDSEDKQMGNFFIKADASEVEFKSKVMFYLWNEVCRDEYHTQNNFFRCKQGNEEKEFSFNEFYQVDGLIKLHGFMEYLGMESQSVTEETEHEEVQETDEV